MFVILCDSFEEVQTGFAAFVDFIETYESENISRILEYAYTIDMLDGIRYVFADYRFKNLFF